MFRYRVPKIVFVAILLATLLSRQSISTPTENVRTAPSMGDPNSLLQFTSHGHTLVFRVGKIDVTNGTYAMHVDFVGANANAPASDKATPSKSSQIAKLDRVTYDNLWNRITLTYQSTVNGIVESTYQVLPGADPSVIRLKYNRPVIFNKDGTLTFSFPTGQMTESAPIAWQYLDKERQSVEIEYTQLDNNQVGFTIGKYNQNATLYIDPTLTWNTFLGGSGDDTGHSIALDESGHIYVAGHAYAPWSCAPVSCTIRAYLGGEDAFVAKLDTNGNLIWNTFLGSSGSDDTYGITVDINGNVFVTGRSDASWGSPVESYVGVTDAFVAKLDSNGALLWNSFLGGSGDDIGNSISHDENGSVFITGESDQTWGSPINSYTNLVDAFVAKLDGNGINVWNTFLGGDGNDLGLDIALDDIGNLYISGTSLSQSWGSPVRNLTFAHDAFAAKLDSNGNLNWNTFLGGTGDDQGLGIAVDGNSNLYIVGYSSERWGSPVGEYSDRYDAFVAKLNTDGNLTWNSFLGGGWDDWGSNITSDTSGNTYITGTSISSWGVPVDPYIGGNDGFVAKLDANGNPTWNTFLGDAGYDTGDGIVLDTNGYVYVTGESGSTWGNPNRTYEANQDVVVVKYFGGVTHVISGDIGVGGVFLSYTDGIAKTAITNAAGNYSISVTDHWSGIITPSKEISPVELLSEPWHLIGNSGAAELYEGIGEYDLQGRNTLRITYNLHGLDALPGDASAIIIDQNGWKYVSLSDYGINGLDGEQTVDIPLSDFLGLDPNVSVGTLHTRFWYSAQFNVDILSIVAYNNSVVGYNFSPSNRVYTNLIDDQAAQNYIATPINHNIISGNAGISGVILNFIDSTLKTTTTDDFGNYTFSVSDNWSGMVTPSKTGYTFSPPNRVYTNIQTYLTGQNYIASISTASESVVINEVGWAGTKFNQGAEWIELFNPTNSSINLNNWRVVSTDGAVSIQLAGAIAAQSYYLLERVDNNTITNVAANQVYNSGLLSNTGASLALYNSANQIVDTVNGNGGQWPAGNGANTGFISSFEFSSLERIDPLELDTDDNWATNDAHQRNGLDEGGQPINGTPLQPNSINFSEGDTVCNNILPITTGQNHLGILRSSGDIDPFSFNVIKPYTTIVATLTPPADGNIALYLFEDCPINNSWGVDQASHIGRRHINIGPNDKSNIEVRFNIGEKTGTYYLAVKLPEDGVYSGAPYQLYVDLQEPNFTTVKTLILYNPARFKQTYGLDAASQVMDKLTLLADYPTVDGVILQLNQFTPVVDAYEIWDSNHVIAGNELSYTNNVTLANNVSLNIRDAMREFLLTAGLLITDNVVIVGDDDQIPYRRLGIKSDAIIPDANWMSEQTYFNSLVDEIANTPIDAAMMADQTLSDDFYGDYMDRLGAEYLPSFAVGRLLDTPGRIQKTIDTFLNNNGVIDLTTPQSKKAAVAGYDFLANAAQQMCDFLTNFGGLNSDCMVDTPLVPNQFTSAELYQKLLINTPNVVAYYGHTNHDQIFTPIGNPLTATQISGANVNLSDSLWWVIGCHSGLLLPDSENYSLSLTQALGDRGITYLGNTGWAYGSDGPLTHSELLYKFVAEELTHGNGMTIGEALRLAKAKYYFTVFNNAYGKGNNISYYDAKVMSQATLYGLPMLKINFPDTVSAQGISLQLETATESVITNLSLPVNFHPDSIILRNLTPEAQQYNGNTYYTFNQEYAALAHVPVLPQSEFFDFVATHGRAKGVIWIGGAYTVKTSNNPLVLNPTQLNASIDAEPAFSGIYPLLPVALGRIQKLDETFTNHLTYQAGQFYGDRDSGTLRLFTDMEFLAGLWNGASTDDSPPMMGLLTTRIVGNTLHITIPVNDSSGIYKTFVTYTEGNDQDTSGLWQSVELTTGVAACTPGENPYSYALPLIRKANYFIQTMDCAGNVSVKFDNGRYFETSIIGDTTGVFRPSNGLLYLKNANTTGFADVAINYGTGGDYPVAGDWDGNGTATIGIYRNGSFYLRNSNTLGFADIVFAFGTPGDQPVAGDWDGDGVDTIGVYSNGQFLLRNSNSAGAADMNFYLGNPGDVGIAGDWNGDGMDTTGVFRPSNGIIFLKNANITGFADVALNYGLAGDMPVTGDWNNDGIDTIGVYRNAQFLLRNSNTIGFAEIVFGLGNPGDMPIAGNWDGIP